MEIQDSLHSSARPVLIVLCVEEFFPNNKFKFDFELLRSSSTDFSSIKILAIFGMKRTLHARRPKKMAKKKFDIDKMKTHFAKTDALHKDWKEQIKQAINDGEHKVADAATKLLTKSRDSLHKVLYVEAHSEKKRPDMNKAKEM